MAQRALDMLAGVRVTGRTENEAALPLHTRLTAVGELTRTNSPVASAMGSICCQKNEVLALQVSHFLWQRAVSSPSAQQQMAPHMKTWCSAYSMLCSLRVVHLEHCGNFSLKQASCRKAAS